jgi:ABC-2 type transport system ATP-binding protein
VGLDPRQIISIRELIRELGRQHTLLLSTHILPEVELLCDRVVIIDGGRIIAQGTPASLRESWTGNPTVRVDLKGDPGDAGETLAAVPGVVGVKAGGIPGTWTLECAPGGDPREAVFRMAVERGWVILELARDRGATLEDIFVRLTTHDSAAGAASAAAAPQEVAS